MNTDNRWNALERHVAAATKRIQDAAPDHGFRGSISLQELYAVRKHIEKLIDLETIDARAAGAQWSALGSSKQQALQRHNAAIRRHGKRSQ